MCVSEESIVTRWALVSAVSPFLATGAVYGKSASHLMLLTEPPVALPVAPNAFPEKVDGWLGKEVPMHTSFERVGRNDGFPDRLCLNRSKNESANFQGVELARLVFEGVTR